MVTINLRDLFISYEFDCFIEVPDNEVVAFTSALTKAIADVFVEFQREDVAYQRNLYRNNAHYSLDRGDGIEKSTLELSPTPLEEYENKLTKQQLYEAIASLPNKQAKRIYAHYVLGLSKTAIAQAEGVRESAVRDAIDRGLRNMEKYLKSFF